jgi:peroxiredoxin
VRLPDQRGALIDLYTLRAGRPALVVFYRSAEWWPFCKTQLVQLQQLAPELTTRGIALVAISFDAVAILRDFAAAHAITYPLLSDEGSHVMRALGLINERVLEDHAAYGIPANPRHVNLPYPGVFVLDGDGIVTRKVFHESYRERDSGPGLLAQTLGIAADPPGVVTHGDGAVRVRAWLDSPTYAFFQRLTLTVEVSTAHGFHVYAAPVPSGLTPLSVGIDPIAGLEVGPAAWPPPRRFAVPGLDDELWVHEGTVRGTLPLTFAAPPGAGDHTITVTVAYQACDDSTCSMPASVRVALAVREVALVGRALPAVAAKTSS